MKSLIATISCCYIILISLSVNAQFKIAILSPGTENIMVDRVQKKWMLNNRISKDSLLRTIINNLMKNSEGSLTFTKYKSSFQLVPLFKLKNKKVNLLEKYIKPLPKSAIGKLFYNNNPRIKIKVAKDWPEVETLINSNASLNNVDYTLSINQLKADRIVQFFPISKNKTCIELNYELASQNGKLVRSYKSKFIVNWKKDMYPEVLFQFTKQFSKQIMDELDEIIRNSQVVSQINK